MLRIHAESHRHAYFWGCLFIVVGGLLLLENIGLTDVGNLICTLWPLVLIGVGLWMIHTSKGQRHTAEGQVRKSQRGDQRVRSESDRVMVSQILGDVDVTISSQNFHGGHISTVFGDILVDLSEIDIASGEGELTLHNVFGDIEVTTPRNVAFAVRGNCVVGDIRILANRQAGLFAKGDYKSEGFDQAAQRLRMYASHLFGDIKVQSTQGGLIL